MIKDNTAMSHAEVDVVIIGAGPAGLACASELPGLKVLVLERASGYGGRIQTIDLAAQRVDMGACFAVDPGVVPRGLAVHPGRRVPERSVTAVCDSGGIHFGATPLDCLTACAIDSETWRQIDHFARSDSDAGALRGSRAYQLLNAQLHQVHPGELAEYDIGHQRDGLYTWYPDHWEQGNQVLTDSLLKQCEAELRLNAEVRQIFERAEGIEVTFRSDEEPGRVRCRAVVIATTADVASSLLEHPEPQLRQWLSCIRYGSYTVVALAGAASPALAEFRSLIPADGSPAVVMQQRSFERDRAVLLCYYCSSDFTALESKTDTELVNMSKRQLAAMGIPVAALDPLYESAVRRWKNAATILSSDYRQGRDFAGKTGSRAVFLAGDYTCREPAVGYGMADAVASGIETAQQVRMALNG